MADSFEAISLVDHAIDLAERYRARYPNDIAAGWVRDSLTGIRDHLDGNGKEEACLTNDLGLLAAREIEARDGELARVLFEVDAVRLKLLGSWHTVRRA